MGNQFVPSSIFARRLMMWVGGTLCVVLVGAASRVGAQDSVPAKVFASTVHPLPLREVAPRISVLHARVSVDFDGITLADALQRLAQKGGLGLTYGRRFGQLDQRVSLHAIDLPLSEAFATTLQGSGLDLLAWPSGNLVVVEASAKISARLMTQGTGTVTGHVVDAALKSSLSEVVVRVDGSTLSATSNGEGKYTVTGVAPGTYQVTARRVGYQPLTKDVTVTVDERATLDFALTATPTRLDEIVTTAVGQQRRYEVGNTISTINADSIAPTAPITSITDLISARAPGVTVLENSGLTGSGEAIRIRGLSSLALQNDPILIVDGVRQDNSPGGDLIATLGNGDHPTPSRLNDIDFSDIATIDILKGPAASTEYGTDAASGVIVLTTKHGTAGPPQWRVSAEQTESGIPSSYPTGYYSWGHLTDGTNAPVNCILFPAFGLSASTNGTCVVDSVTRWNALNHPATSIFGTGNRGKYDLSVGGGSEAVRYYVAGGLANETGIARMPSAFRQIADTAGVYLPPAALNANVEQQRSVRANTAIKLGSRADLSVTASYLSTYQTTPEAGALLQGLLTGPAIGDAAHYYGYDHFAVLFGATTGALNPIDQLIQQGSQNTNRVTGGLTATWRPTGWFIGHGTFGLDHGSQGSQELTYPQTNTQFGGAGPFLAIGNSTTDVYSVDLRGTATASLGRGVRAVTSAGLQMVDTRNVGQTASTRSITPTNLTLNGATGVLVGQEGTRNATLGGYGEEQLSLADRLFLTGALRIDAASGFGSAYSTAAYPKASVSWLAVDRTGTTLRMRAAFGESGQQPANGAALQLYMPQVTYVGGTDVPTSGFSQAGNPTLRPERSAEFEGGVDLGAWGNRLSVELTGYEKDTHDALVDVDLGATFNDLPYQENIGEVRNTGAEISATVGIIQTRSTTWDITVNGSVNHNTLLSLSPGVTAEPPLYASYQQRVGYPLYGLWGYPLIYADANHDGIIEEDEVAVPTDESVYQGPGLPTREISLATHIGLWRGTVALSALADYRGGYRVQNNSANLSNVGGNTREVNDPTAPLPLQARASADFADFFNSGFFEDGSFVRIREVGLTYVLSRSLTRALRVASVSLTGAVRNLVLWTRYTGADPEATDSNGNNNEAMFSTGTSFTNNNSRQDYGAVPLARYVVVRLNVGF